MFDASSIEEYRAVKAPAALKARLDEAPVAAKPRLSRILPLVAAVAACLVLVALGLFHTDAPQLQITAQPLAAIARSNNAAPLPCAEIRLTMNGTITLEHADASVLTARSKALTFPYTAENELVLIWKIDEPETTLTVNGQTYTVTADLTNGTITVQ